jgi:hypothetical protein
MVPGSGLRYRGGHFFLPFSSAASCVSRIRPSHGDRSLTAIRHPPRATQPDEQRGAARRQAEGRMTHTHAWVHMLTCAHEPHTSTSEDATAVVPHPSIASTHAPRTHTRPQGARRAQRHTSDVPPARAVVGMSRPHARAAYAPPSTCAHRPSTIAPRTRAFTHPAGVWRLGAQRPHHARMCPLEETLSVMSQQRHRSRARTVAHAEHLLICVH